MAASPRVDSVAIIGAGSGGLAAAKYLLAERAFSTLVVFEQRRAVGGVWVATPRDVMEGAAGVQFPIPCTRPQAVPRAPVWARGGRGGNEDGEAEGDRFEFVSPMYDDLVTNIPHSLMRYSDLASPDGCALFPRHDVVREYLDRYADDVRHLIRFGAQVLDVHLVDDEEGGCRWSVTVRDLKAGGETSMFDAVVVANGHYNDPFVPDIPGIGEWDAAYPGAILHSKFYRRPSEYKDKASSLIIPGSWYFYADCPQKVIVVGNSASGIDVAAQVSLISQRPLLFSEKDTAVSFASVEDTGAIESLPVISQFNTEDRSVQFANGRIEKHVDHIVFCTGYLYSFPFLRTLDPPPATATGTRAQNLYQHIFYTPRPTLSFIGLPQRIVPFPVSEGQGAVIARVLSGRLSLPSRQEMRDWEVDMVAQRGAGRAFHVLEFPQDAAYLNFLHDWSLQASRRLGLGDDGRGKVPPCWGEEEQWVRKRTPLIKAAALKLKSGQSDVRTLRELGFDYEEWKREERAE